MTTEREVTQADGVLTWAQEAWEGMLLHAQRDKPREACGALLGLGSQVNAIAPMTNTDPSPDHYRIDPAETLALFEAIDEGEGVELVGWYHSHPRTSCRPSDLDLDLAVPGFYYVIVGIDRVATFSV